MLPLVVIECFKVTGSTGCCGLDCGRGCTLYVAVYLEMYHLMVLSDIGCVGTEGQ